MDRGRAPHGARANDAMRSRCPRGLPTAAAVALTALVFSFALGTPAQAVLVRTPAGHAVSFQPTVARAAVARTLRSLGPASLRGRRLTGASDTSTTAGTKSASTTAGAYQPCTAAESACLRYYGGSVMRTTTLTPIFWNPSGLGLSYPSEYEKEVSQFFVDLAADSGKKSNFFSVLTQYSDNSGAISYSVTSSPGLNDTDALPSGAGDQCTSPWSPSRPCVTDEGLRTELKALIAREGLATGLGHEYVVFFPPGMDSCFGSGGSESTECSGTGYCGYHTTVTVGASSAQYANEPDNGDPRFKGGCTSYPSLTAADLTVDTASHEISESVTDPEVQTTLAWYDENIVNTTLGEVEYGEIGDICSWEFKQGDEALAWVNGSDAASTSDQTIDGHPYLLQTEWDNAHSTCSISVEAAAAAAPPTASFSIPSTKALTSEMVSVDASASTGTITSYEWSWGDGSTPQSSSSPTAAHEYSTTEGTLTKTFTVTLTVTDAKGEKASISKPVEIEDRKPSASFASPSGALEGQPVTFDGSSSNDPDGTIAGYHWTFGDGQSATGANPSHTYATAGTYTATLTVTDNSGQTESVSHPVTVAATPPPTASFLRTPGSPVSTAESVSFDGSASSGPSPIVSYEWNWGDGSPTSTSTSPTATHSYSATEGLLEKTFVVTLKVTDSEGKTATTSRTVEVRDRKPSASFASPSGALEGQPVTFDGSSSNDPDGTIAGYHWTFGDGQSATGANPSHTYATAGTYTVTLTVTDNSGQTESVSHPVTVASAVNLVSVDNSGASLGTQTSVTTSTVTTSGAAAGSTTAAAGSATTTTSTPSASPGNFIRIVSSKQDRKSGSISLIVAVPGPGMLELADARAHAHKKRGARSLVRVQKLNVANAGTVVLQVIPASAARAALKHSHRVPVNLLITFSPAGGAPRTITRSVVLRLDTGHKHT